MNSTNSNDYLITEHPLTLMRKYSVPCIISLLVAALYNIVDQIFIANADYLGSYGNAANTVVFPMTVLALAVAVMIGDGACVLVSRCLGARKSDRAAKTIGCSVVLVVIISLVITAVYLIGMEPILGFFGGKVNEETYKNAHEYFFWISLGIPFYMFGQAMNPIIRSDGSPKFAMASTLAGAAVNIVLDPLFIYPMHMGMMGAAVATVAGQILTTVLSVWYLFHMKLVKLERDSFGIFPKLIGQTIPLGITSFLSQASLVVSMAAVQNMCTKYGALDPVFSQPEFSQIPLAVLGIVMKFFQIAISIAVGLAAGCIPVVGFNIGAGRKDRAKQLFSYLLAAEAIVGTIAFLIVEIMPGQLISIFGASNESSYYTEFAVRSFRIYLCLMALAMINKGTFIYLQALGKAVESVALSLCREIIFGVAFPIILPIFFGLNGLLYSFPCSDLITFLIAVVIIRRTYADLSASGFEAGKTEAEKHTSSIKPAHEGTIITISREHGTRGKQIGQRLADELGIPFYYKETIAVAAEESGLSEEFMSDINRNSPEMMKELYLSSNVIQIAIQAQAAAIKKIAAEGSCVIVGRAADFVLQNNENVKRIFLYAPEEYCAKQVSEMYGDAASDAARSVMKTNQARAAYYHSISGSDWKDPHNYDLCLDCENGVEETVKKILAWLQA